MADDILALTKAFLEEVAVNGAGPFADRPAFNALREALRPIPAAPPEIPSMKKAGEAMPMDKEGFSSVDHAAALSEA